MPNNVVLGDPAASSTTSMSCSVVSMVGESATRSDSPDPRRSMTINLLKPASRSRNRAIEGYIQAYSMLDRKPDTSKTSIGPSPTTW